jgi:hypothetical protein
MKAKLICAAILALASFNAAAAQDAVADANDSLAAGRVLVCDDGIRASEEAFRRSSYVFEQRRALGLN